jgi:solute carrier family 25 iron transporter 28/37
MQLMMNIPYTAIHFATYESSKTYFGNGDDETLVMQLGAGGIAGGLAAAATTPMDVVKTRLQLEGLGSATKYNTISMVRTVKF